MVTFLADLNAAVYGDVAYSTRMEAGVQTPDQTLSRKIGLPRLGWLLVTALRQCGLAARLSRAISFSWRPMNKRSTVRAEPARTSPTCTPGLEVYIPGAGWIGLDPTSALFAGEGHIPSPQLPTRPRRPLPGPPSPVW